MIKQN